MRIDLVFLLSLPSFALTSLYVALSSSPLEEKKVNACRIAFDDFGNAGRKGQKWRCACAFES